MKGTTNHTMENIAIRKATPADIDQLQQIGRQTFFETFSESNTEENMQDYLEKGFSITKLNQELNDENSAFFFAISANRVIGYLKLNFGDAQAALKTGNTLEIQRIYVLNEFHGKKAGQMLFDKAMEIAIQKNVDAIWLGVWEENPRAISFYRKNGFIAFDKHIFKLGNDEQTDILMKLQLKNE